VTKQPPLITPDGTELSLDTSEWWLSGGAVHVQAAVRALVDRRRPTSGPTTTRASTATARRGSSGSSLGQVRRRRPARQRAGGRRTSPATSSRPTTCATSWTRLKRTTPSFELQASGSIRRDKITYGLSLKVGGALLEPDVRHYVSAAPSMTWDHRQTTSTLSFDAAITKRELPGPHPDELDNADYELISRASYAEPISLSGSLNLRVFWDRSNDALNDRLDDM
jgi:hypothetical protein